MEEYAVLATIALNEICKNQPLLFNEMVAKYGSPREVCKLVEKNKIADFPPMVRRNARNFDLSIAKDIKNYCANNRIHIIIRQHEKYPEMLKNIDGEPNILYCKGDLSVLDNDYAAAVVGRRKADSYSIRVTERFSTELSNNGFVIVSGCANGIDRAAHRATIAAKGKTISVLGCGCDYDYPVGSDDLKREICKNGLLISEYPPLDPPRRDNFKVRNRIISGLCQCVLVIQAGKISGSLNTAYHALDQGREVYVIPPADLFSGKYMGQIHLLSEGAVPVYSPEQIIDDIM